MRQHVTHSGNPLFGIFIVPECLKRFYRAGVILCFQQRFCPHVTDLFFCIFIVSECPKRFYRAGVIPGGQQLFRRPIPDARDDHLKHHEQNRNHDRDPGEQKQRDLFPQLRGARLLGGGCGELALSFLALRPVLLLQLLDTLFAGGRQLVRVPPAGNLAKLSDGSVVGIDSGVPGKGFVLPPCDKRLAVGINRVLAGLLSIPSATLRQRLGVLIAGDRVELPGRRKKCLLRRRPLHLLHRAAVNPLQTGVFVAFIDIADAAAQLVGQRVVGKAQGFFVISVPVKGRGAVAQSCLCPDAQLGHQLAEIGAGALRLEVEHLLAVGVGLVPLAVLEEHERPLEQRRAPRLRHGRLGLRRGGLRRFGCGELLDAADQILHEAQLGHILRLQMRKFVGQVVGVHVAVGRNEHLFRAVFDEREVTAPLVLDPDGVEILRPRAQHDHDLGRVQRREDVRLVGRAELILQRDAREEHLEALLRELVVKVVGKDAVGRAAAVLVGLLVADEHVEGLLPGRDLQNALLNLVDGVRLLLVEHALGGVGAAQRGLVVLVGKDRGILRTVDRGQALVRRGVLDILDAVAAQDERPVSLGVAAVLVENLLIDSHGLVKIVVSAEVVCAVVEVCAAVVVQTGQGLLCAAGIAHADGIAGVEFDRPAAHLALENAHASIAPFIFY